MLNDVTEFFHRTNDIIKQIAPIPGNQHRYQRVQQLFRQNYIEYKVNSQDKNNENKRIILISNNYLDKLVAILRYILILSPLQSLQMRKNIDNLMQSIDQLELQLISPYLSITYCCGAILQSTDDINTMQCGVCDRIFNLTKKTKQIDKFDEKYKNTAYAAMKHFDSCFRNIFVGPQQYVDDVLINKIKTMIHQDRREQIDIDDVRMYLKQIKRTDCNKIASQIMQIVNGQSVVRISNDEYMFMKDFYNQIINVFYQINSKRNNTPNCLFFIKKMVDILYSDDDEKRKTYSQLIYLQKENTINKIDKIWTSIYRYIDIDTAKAKFAEMMAKQIIA